MEFLFLWLLTLFLLLMLIFYIGLLYSPLKTKVPYVPSFNSDLKIIWQQLDLKPWKSIVDLGCWDWKALRYLKKTFDLWQADGYDINPMPIILWKIYNFFQNTKNINLYVKDFNQVNLKRHDYIYLYLFPELLEKIEDNIFSKISTHWLIISNSFQFKKHKPVKILKSNSWKWKIYIYTK